jgi:hypothetical protein
MISRIISDIVRAETITRIDDLGDQVVSVRPAIMTFHANGLVCNGRIQNFDPKTGYVRLVDGPTGNEHWITLTSIDAVTVKWCAEGAGKVKL